MRLNKRLLLALALAALLVAPAFHCKEDPEEVELEAEDDPYEDGEEDEGPAKADDAKGDADESAVVVVTDKNVDEVLGKAKFALVMFYAPWCGHCKSMKPAYAAAALQLKESHPDVIIAKVDATEEKDLASKHEIQGFPTLKWFVDGKLAGEYGAGRTTDDIIRWVTKKTGSATSNVETVEALQAAAGKVLLLAYFDKFEGADHAAYEAAAQKDDNVHFLKTTAAEVAKKWGIKKALGFALGRNYSDHDFESVAAEGHPAFKGDDLEAKLEGFVKAERLPAYLPFSQENQPDIFQGGVNKQAIVTAPAKLLEKGSALEKAIREAAKAVKGELIFVTNPLGTGEDGASSEASGAIVKFFGLDAESKEPQVVGFAASDNKKFLHEGKATADELAKFAKGVVDGTAKKFFKSAPEPKEPTEGGVTIVVGNTVDKIVRDPTKDVLLEIYAPWCGHCKQLAPVYEKLAKRFSKVDSVVIAKMDGTENEHPDVSAQGFPTIIFFPAEKGAEPVPFDSGDRSLASLTKFIKQHAKVPFELPKKKKEESKEDGHDEL